MTPILLIFSLTCLLQGAPETAQDPAVAENAVEDGRSDRIPRSEDDSRTPLLREGVFLNQVPGTIRFDQASGFWRFHNDLVEVSQTTRFGRTFGLLPSSPLDDAIGRIESSDTDQRFEMSARVTVYRGLNYLLPTLVTAVSDLNIDAQAELVSAATDEPELARSDGPRNTLDDQDDTADRLEERLRRRLGSLPVGSDGSDALSETSLPTVPMAEGDRIQNRRCSILRDQRSGTWRIVFDSENSDQRDPTMEILPCLLLETLERRAAQSDLPPSILISGEVTRFRGRSYLLPTRWRSASSSSNIQR